MLVLLILLVPAFALSQEPMLVTPDDVAPILDPSALPALFPTWVERVLSYVTVGGAALVACANLAGKAFSRWRAAGRSVHPALELVVGLLLDVGTDLSAVRERLLGAPKN